MGQGFPVEELSQTGHQLIPGSPGMPPSHTHPSLPPSERSYNEPLLQKLLDSVAGSSPGRWGGGAWVQVSSNKKRPALTDETEDWPN